MRVNQYPIAAEADDDDFILLLQQLGAGTFGLRREARSTLRTSMLTPAGVDEIGEALAAGGWAGEAGWSPVLAVVADGSRRVLKVAAWTGGEGTAPAAGQYVGASGLVATAAEAVDIRGATGPAGAGSGDMLKSVYDPNDDGLIALAQGGTGKALADPGADRLLGWDESAGAGGEMAFLSPANGIEVFGTSAQMTAAQRTRTIVFMIDGGGAAITAGLKGFLPIDVACTIQSVTALGDQTGSIVVDIWKDTYANFPPTDADSITASAPVTISSGVKSQDSTLTGWNKTIAAGDVLGWNVDSASAITRATIALKVLVG